MAATPQNAALERSANGVGGADIKRVMAPTPRSGRASADAVRHVRLWDEHAQRIYRYCFRRTADRELAEDLTGRVSRSVAKRQRCTRSRRRTALALWHRRQRRAQPVAQAAETSASARGCPRHQADLAQDAVDHLADEEQMRRVVTKLRSLPQIEQDVLTLCAWEDLTPKEAADSPSVALRSSTVRTRLHRARTRACGSGPVRTWHPPVPVAPRVEGEGS